MQEKSYLYFLFFEEEKTLCFNKKHGVIFILEWAGSQKIYDDQYLLYDYTHTYTHS